MVYSFPGPIHFSWGEAEKVAEHIETLGMIKPLIVTDEEIVKIGLLKGIEKKLDLAGINFSLYKGVHPNPTEDDVLGGVTSYEEGGCDSVIAVGGGSSIDAARGVLLMVSHPGDLKDYYWGAPDMRPIIDKIPPFIAVPTTSGTGSEASTGAIITDSDNRKRAIDDPKLFPGIIILDPSLTVSMPPKLTAYTGLDALSHNLEAFLVDAYAPISDAFAREGMRLVADILETAYTDGANKRARMDMMMASTMGALAFLKGLGVVHSLAHQLSTECDIPHGAACGIMIPHSIRFNLEEKNTWSKYKEIAEIFNPDSKGKVEATDAAGLMDTLLETLGVEPKLSNWGVTNQDIQVMAKNAMLDHCHPYNPRICTEEALLEIFRTAL
jgi:alcohol dehydrogenase class IV